MVTASLSAACSALTPSGWCRELMGVELEEPGLEPRGALELLLLLLLLEREEHDERIGQSRLARRFSDAFFDTRTVCT